MKEKEMLSQEGRPNQARRKELRNAAKSGHQSEGTGEWTNALTSGLVAGGVFLFARFKLEGAAAFIVPGLAMTFFITNGNFQFSYAQKAFAIAIMFMIGMFGQDVLAWFLQNQSG